MIRGVARRFVAVPECGVIGSGIMGQVTHAGTFTDQPISQSNPKDLHAPVRTGSRVVTIKAAMRAAAGHFSEIETGAFEFREFYRFDFIGVIFYL